MSEQSIEQQKPHWLVPIALRVAPFLCWLHVFIALIGIRRWFEGKSNNWEVLWNIGFTAILFSYAKRLRETHGPESAREHLDQG